MIFTSSKVLDGNMSLMYGETAEVLKNRKKFFKKLAIASKKVVEVKQVHGNKVIVADTFGENLPEADGLITNKRDVLLMIKVADCMAISFDDPIHQAIALVHAGFRGLRNGIIKNTVLEMIKHYQSNPKDLIVKISPSVGPCHYKMDIWQEAENQLIRVGILKGNITNPKICTYESPDYFSHRRSQDTKTAEGRFVVVLGL